MAVVRRNGAHRTRSWNVSGMLRTAWTGKVAAGAVTHGMTWRTAHVGHGAGWTVMSMRRRSVHVRRRLFGVSRCGSVAHAHTTRASRSGGLTGWAWRWARGGSAHAIDGAGDADAAWCLCGGARGSGDGDEVALAWIQAALDAVARRQERVEALDEARVTAEERRDSLNDTGGIYRLALELEERKAKKMALRLATRFDAMRLVRMKCWHLRLS